MFVICHIEISFSDSWEFLASGFWLSKFWQMQLKSTKKSKNDITLRLPCCQWNWATLLVNVLKFTKSLQILEIKPPPRPCYDEPLNIFAVRIQSSNIVYQYNTKKKKGIECIGLNVTLFCVAVHLCMWCFKVKDMMNPFPLHPQLQRTSCSKKTFWKGELPPPEMANFLFHYTFEIVITKQS